MNDQPSYLLLDEYFSAGDDRFIETDGLAAQNRDKHPYFQGWVGGMLAYIEMVNPKQAAPLRVAYDAVAKR